MVKTAAIASLFLGGALSCFCQDSIWNLVWSDEFNGRFLDTNFWNYDLGTGNNGWDNGELQNYTKDNITFKDSCLVIELRKQTLGASEYTSSRITTRNKVYLQYGRIQTRVKAPYSQAVWPAIWTLGADFNPPSSVPWPACGEIDIFEMACGDNRPDDKGDNVSFAVVHYTDLADFLGEAIKGVYVSGRMADNFHIFTVEWDEKFLSFYFNSAATPYLQVDITKSYMSEFHQPHSLTINMALGGYGFALWPDASTVLPQYLTVDWIRWYQKKTGVWYGYERRDEAVGHSVQKNTGGLSFNILFPSRSRLCFFDLRGRLVADLSGWARAQTPGRHGTSRERLPMRRGAYIINFYDGVRAENSTIVLP